MEEAENNEPLEIPTRRFVSANVPHMRRFMLPEIKHGSCKTIFFVTVLGCILVLFGLGGGGIVETLATPILEVPSDGMDLCEHEGGGGKWSINLCCQVLKAHILLLYELRDGAGGTIVTV